MQPCHGDTAASIDVIQHTLQALDMFIASQTLHKPLLIRIKAAYEEVLRDVLQMAYDHIQLQQLLSVTLKQGVSKRSAAEQLLARVWPLHVCLVALPTFTHLVCVASDPVPPTRH